jgi:hypothetical protein
LHTRTTTLLPIRMTDIKKEFIFRKPENQKTSSLAKNQHIHFSTSHFPKPNHIKFCKSTVDGNRGHNLWKKTRKSYYRHTILIDCHISYIDCMYVICIYRTEHNFYWCEIHIQRIVTKTTHYIQNKETVKYNQTTCLKCMPH